MDFIDSFDTCQMLHISDRTLRRLVRRGIIQMYRLEGCRKNYFSKKQITDMMRAQSLVSRIEKH